MRDTSGKKRAWLYGRVAYPDLTMLEMQRLYLINYAEKQGLVIAGISAEHSSGRNFSRPGLNEAFEAIKNGRADLLLIVNYSRLGRDTVKTYECVQWLSRYHAEVVCADGTIIQDSSEPLDDWLKAEEVF